MGAKSPLPRRRLPAHARREAIARAVLPLFARQGLDGTTSKELAEAAGVSEALIFRYFPTKEALYTAIYEYCSASFELDYRKIARLAPSPLTLTHIVYFLVRGILIKRAPHADAVVRLFYRSFLEDGNYARLTLHGPDFVALRKKFEACVKACQTSGLIRRTEISLTNLFWYTHHVSSVACLARLADKPVIDYGDDINTTIAEIVHFTLRGIGMTEAAIAEYADPASFALLSSSPDENLLNAAIGAGR